jgi:phosphatidylglycerol:prolipoprotein diacylglycerol transferase
MHPTLFSIGKWHIPTYTVLLDVGLVLGLALTYLEGKRLLGEGGVALDLGLWTVVGGLVGGRVGYAAANWRVFAEDWVRAFRIWEGGLSFHGAFLGGLLALLLFAHFCRRRTGFWQLADALTPGLALGVSFGWAACLMGGCAYGLIGEGPGYAILPDHFGVEAPRFVTQMVGLGYALVLLAGSWLLRRHWPFPGAAFLLYVLLYFAGMFFLEFTRGDEAVYLGPWRLTQVLDLAFALAAAVGLMVLWWRSPAETERAEG